MLVKTVQGYNLREFRGRIELSRGTYRDDEVVSGAQRRLYRRLNEDQLVWCVQDNPILVDEVGRFLHEIEVDSRDIVAIVDTLVWCHIIGYGSRYILPDDHADLEFQGMNSGNGWDEVALRRAEDDYLAKNLPTELWLGVTKSGITKKSDQVLVRFPFAFSTIVDVRVVSEEMANGRPDSKRRMARPKRAPRPS